MTIPAGIRSPASPVASPAPGAALREGLVADQSALGVAWGQLLEEVTRRFQPVPELAHVGVATVEYLRTTGKRLRPLLLLGSHRLFSAGKPPPPAVVSAAAAVELFHAFSLIHDDLVDASDHRRGQPSLHRRFEALLGIPPKAGHDLALVIGDILFGLSIERLLDDRLAGASAAARYFLRICQETGLGEALELRHQHQPLAEVSVAAIYRTYRLKTTRYTFAAPLVLGARLAGADNLDCARLEGIAEPLGLAFQLENDLHELLLPPTSAVAAGWDLHTGVKTLPLRRLLDRLEGGSAEWLEGLLAGATPTTEDCARLQQLLHDTGVLAALRAEIQESFAEARERLDQCDWPEPRREALAELVEVVRALCRHSEAR